MDNALTIAGLRRELALSQQEFAELIGLSSKGNVSILERGGPCSLAVALRLEELSGGRIDAAGLNQDVAAARAKPDWALTPAEIETIPSDTAPHADASTATLERVIICDVCSQRVDDAVAKSCSFVDCPHSERIAA